MRIVPSLLLLLCFLAPATPPAQNTASPAPAPETAIRRVLEDQAAAWNRGDIPAFMQGYKDAPDTTFVDDKVERGYQQILTRYQAHYTGKSAMGTLAFSDLAIRPLDPQYAVATGRFRLDFPPPTAPASGIFSLVWQRTPSGWKIILDHTSADRPNPATAH